MRYVWNGETWVPASTVHPCTVDVAVGSAGWPMVSDAAAVDPSQVPGMIEEAKKRGVSVRYTKLGQPIFENRAHRASYLKAFGYVDRAGGYGDHTGSSRETEERARDREETEARLREGLLYL